MPLGGALDKSKLAIRFQASRLAVPLAADKAGCEDKNGGFTRTCELISKPITFAFMHDALISQLFVATLAGVNPSYLLHD